MLVLLVSLVCALPAQPPASLRLLLTADLCARSRDGADFLSSGVPRRRLGGWAGLERTLDSLRARPALHLDCGNFAFGSLEGDASRGRLGVELLNAVGCDAAAVGARDFSGGLENLEMLALSAAFPVVSDPMLDVALRRRAPLFRPYVLLQRNDLKVAVVGLLDPETRALNHPSDVPGIPDEPVLAQCRRFVAAAARESAHVTLVIGYIGAEGARLIADSVDGVDIVVAGAADGSLMRFGSKSCAVVPAGRLGQRVGVLDLLVDRTTRSVQCLEYNSVVVEPGEPGSERVGRLVARADSVTGPDTVRCVVAVEFGLDSAGVLSLGATVCRLVAARHRADLALLPWSALAGGLAAGRAGMRDLAAAVPYGERLIVVGLDDTALARLVANAASDANSPALPAWGIDYYVEGDTAAWPAAGRVMRPRVRQRKLGPYRVVTTAALYARSELGFDAHGLPANLTLDWISAALASDTLRPEPIPRRLPAGPGLTRPAATSGLVNINTAGVGALIALPGIGPRTAERIVEYRSKFGRFGSVDDLLNVRGIGPKKLETLRALVTVR